MAQIRLLSTTLILTLLIWASADSLVNGEASIGIAVSVVPAPGASGMFVRLESASDAVEIKVSGPQRIIESLQARGARRVRLPVPDSPTGSTSFPLDRQQIKRALAEQSSDFSRLVVVAVQPEAHSIFVDHMVSREIDVTFKRAQTAYEVEPQLQPAKVTVRMRESVLSASAPDQPSQLDISADVERLLREQPFGKSVTVTLVLDKRPFGPDAELVPSTVDVTATVKARRSTEKIPTVPVLVAVSFANLQRPFSAITRDGSLLSLVTQTITVTGPTEEVGRLQRGETRAYGLIQIKEDDFDQMDVFKLVTPEYHLPKGIELSEDPAPIEFKIVYVSVYNDGG
jgi:hypothetical protein